MSAIRPIIATYFCPRIENIWTVTFAAPAAIRRKLQVWNFVCKSLWSRPLQRHIARAEIFFGGLKKHRI